MILAGQGIHVIRRDGDHCKQRQNGAAGSLTNDDLVRVDTNASIKGPIRVEYTFLGGREVFGPGMTDPGPIDGPDPD